MYTLYYSPGACSMAVHVVLNEIGADFKLKEISLERGDNRDPEFLKLNPRGQVPVLEENGEAYREGAAILLHLLEKHKSMLLPASGRERAEAIEWLMFCNATLHPAFVPLFMNKKTADKPELQNTALLELNKARLQKLWDSVDERLAQTPYLAGANITVADILLTVFGNWAAAFKLNLGKNVTRLFKEVSSRPSYQKALQAEKIEYKAAA